MPLTAAEKQRRYRHRKRAKQAAGDGGDTYGAYKLIADEWAAEGLSRDELAGLVQAKFVTLLPHVEDPARLAQAALNILTVADSVNADTAQSAKQAGTLLLLNGCTCGAADRILAKHDTAEYDETP